MVFVDREKSSLYAKVRITIRDKKANSIAITIVPANGRDGRVIPKAIAITAPREAPDDTPRVDPSARGFLKRPCIAAPQREIDAPVSATEITRGSLTDRMIAGEVIVSGIGRDNNVFHSIVTVSFRGIFTLPTETQMAKVTIVTKKKSRYSVRRKPSRLFVNFASGL
jgi:hypothetical protein